LTARAALTPRQPDVDVLARNQLEEQLAREDLPEGVTRMQRLREIRQRLLVEHNLVPPAGQRRWDFGVITGIDDAELTLQYRFSAARMDIATLKGRWLIGTPERIDLIEIGKESIPRALNEITFSLDQRWREQPLVITYVDGDPAGAAMIFDADGGLILLKPRGGFGANYVRALLIVFGQLSFFAALGVTAGCLFSLPVAAFVSLFLLTMIQMGGYIQGVAQTEVVPPWQAAAPEEAMPAGTMVVALVFKATAFLMSPLIHESALNSISTGRMVDVSWAFRGFILQGMVYSLLMSGLAAYVMNRRELALPPS